MSVKRISSAVSATLVKGVVAVFDEVFVEGVDEKMSEKVTRAFVGVDLLVIVRGILEVELTEVF